MNLHYNKTQRFNQVTGLSKFPMSAPDFLHLHLRRPQKSRCWKFSPNKSFSFGIKLTSLRYFHPSVFHSEEFQGIVKIIKEVMSYLSTVGINNSFQFGLYTHMPGSNPWTNHTLVLIIYYKASPWCWHESSGKEKRLFCQTNWTKLTIN